MSSRRLYETVKAKKDHIDILYASVGFGEFKTPLGAISEANFDSTFSVNVRGTLFTVQKALPLMLDGGSIIMIGSIASVKGFPGLSVYNASKASTQFPPINMRAFLSATSSVRIFVTAVMIASVVPSAAWSGQRRYDRTLYTMSCSRACSTTFSPKSSFGPTSVTGALLTSRDSTFWVKSVVCPPMWDARRISAVVQAARHRFLPALRSSTAGYPRFRNARPIPSMTRSWILQRSWKAVSRNASYTGSGR
jgi:Enoyl-(Acyl carrier protein) reductase